MKGVAFALDAFALVAFALGAFALDAVAFVLPQIPGANAERNPTRSLSRGLETRRPPGRAGRGPWCAPPPPPACRAKAPARRKWHEEGTITDY
jgi:hypothetical protein